MANPWEFNWQWDDLDPTPEAPKPVTTRQQLASKSARANDPWTLNFDFGRAEAAAGAQDYDRIKPMVTVGSDSAAAYVQQEEYQMPELLHEEKSQRDFIRPKGEMFHARSYVPGAVPEQRVITDRMEPWEIFWRTAARGTEDVVQTGYAMAGGDPRDIPTMPLTYLDNPMTVESAWEDPGMATEQAAGMIVRMYPMIAAGVGGAMAGASGAIGVAGTEILGSAAGAMTATFAQSMGPRFKQMLMQYPDDPERAWREAGNATLIDVGATGIGGLLIGAGPLGTSFKQAMFQTFGLRPMAELTGRQLAGNLAIQTLGIQPLVGVANMQAVDAYLGQDSGLTIGDEYLNNLAPSLVQTGAEIVGRQAMAPFAKKTAPGGVPNMPSGDHFTDQIAEANDLEKLAADLRTSPEIAAQIPEGLKFQIDQGDDPFKDYRDPTLTLNASLKSKLSEVLNKMPEGTKLAGQQWYNTLKNAGVKDEELSDYGFDAMLSTNHEENRTKIWTREQLLGQFEANDYAIIREERGDGQTTYGPDEGYSELSTPDIEAYRENLFTLRNRESTPLNVYGAKRGIDVQSLRRDADNGHKDAEAAYNLLLAEHRAYLKFRKDNPAWSKKHAPGDDFPEDATHWDSAGNVLMHDRTGELVFNDGERSHHIDENQSDYIQANKDTATRDMPEAEANEISRFAHGEFERKLIDGDLRDMSFLDDSLLPGVELNGSKLDDLESVFTETNPSRSYSWVNGLREGLIRFAERPETFRQDERNRILKYVDPDKLSAQLPKMKDVSERAKVAINDVMKVRNLPRGPQNVPLKKSWSKAVFKAEVVKAINKGLKRLTWTSGDVQMKRNDVGQRLSEIQIEKTDNARYNIYARDLNGDVVLSRQGLFDEGVRAYLGMDLANRALKKIDSMPEDGVGNYTTLGPDELKNDRLGGSFHEKLYDEKMVQWAKEIGKKYGKRPYQVTYTDNNGGQHKMWAMDLVPEMAENLYRYQVDDGTPARELVAVHQMSYGALAKLLSTPDPGIPKPSIAIIKHANGLGDVGSFGSGVTFVATKDIIDPASGTRVFSADVNSPGVPRTKYIVDPAARSKTDKTLKSVAEETKSSLLTDQIVEKVGDVGLIALADSHAVVTMYARDAGHQRPKDKIMSSEGEKVKALREWAIGSPGFREWLNLNFGKLIASKRIVKREARRGKTERLANFTVEAMVRAMNQRPIRGDKDDYVNAAYFRGLGAKEFRSLEEIRSESGRLLSVEESAKVFDELDAKYTAVIEELSLRAESWDGGATSDKLNLIDSAKEFIVAVARSNGSARKVGERFSGFTANDIDVAKKFLVDMEDTASPYFEAKPRGRVNLDEWGAVILGKDAPQALIDGLRDHGVKRMVFVEPGDVMARDNAIRAVADLHFQVDAEPTDKTVTQAAGDTRKVSLTKKQQKQFRNLIKNLLSEIKRINPLADVRFVERFIGFTEDGTAINVNGISSLLGIGVGIGRNKDAMGTSRHEATHTVMWLMDNLKAWKKGEREAFVEWYENVLSKTHEAFLKNYRPEDRFEEAIAQELGVNRNKWKGYPQAVRNALYRIEGILKAIRTAFKRAFGRKLNPEDIAAMFDAGIMARRAARKLKRLQGKTRGSTLAITPDGSLAYQVDRKSLRDTVLSSQLDNTLYGKVDNPAIGTKLKKGTGSQWRAELIKQGVKLEELKDSGLDSFLTDNASKPMTLQDVISAREERRIELHLVMADDGTKSYVPSEEDVKTTPENDELARLEEEFKALDLDKRMTELSNVDHSGSGRYIRNRVMDELSRMAHDEILADPDRFDKPHDPRHPYYILDRQGDVEGRWVITGSNGQELDSGWIDPLNKSWAGSERRSLDVHRRIIENELANTLNQMMYHFPDPDQVVEPKEIKNEGQPDFYYYPVRNKRGQSIKLIEGNDRADVIARATAEIAKSKVTGRVEYRPIDTTPGTGRPRYRLIRQLRSGHEAISLMAPLEELIQSRDNANKNNAQMWLERTTAIRRRALEQDGEIAHRVAREVIKNSYGSAVTAELDALNPAISMSLATNFRRPDDLVIPYPHFDVDKFRRLETLRFDRNESLNRSRRDDTSFSSWTLPGGNYRREYLITAPDLNVESGEVVGTHFHRYEDENVVAHLRLAEFYTEEGEIMNMSDEFQSDVMQRASEAREELIKKFGFTPRPDLGFGKKAIDEEFSGIFNRGKELKKEHDNTFQNTRALAGALVDQLAPFKVGDDFGGHRSRLKSFAMLHLDESTPYGSDDLPYMALDFVEVLLSSMSEIGMTNAHDKKIKYEDVVIAALEMTGRSTNPKHKILSSKRARAAFLEDTRTLLKGLTLPEGASSFPGAKTLHDAVVMTRRALKGMRASREGKMEAVKHLPYTESVGPGVTIAPERVPHKKSWGLLTFKIALWDAVMRGHQWVGFTTGQQQVERYGSALRKAVSNIEFNRSGDKTNVKINLRSGEPKKLSKVSQSELARYIGKGAAEQIFKHPEEVGVLDGDNIDFIIPGVMDHYDRGIPKEIKPLTDKLKMTLGMKKIGEMQNNSFIPLHEVHGMRVTPEAVEAVKSGQLFKYQVSTDDLSGTLESQLDTVLMPDSPARTKLKKGTGAQWRAELTKQGVKLEELRDSGLDQYFTENKDTQLSLDQVFQYRQGNRIDIIMKVLDDGTKPLVARKNADVATRPEDSTFSLSEHIDSLDSRYTVHLRERIDELVNEWVNEDDDFDSESNPRYRYESRQRRETEYELVEYSPDGDIEEYIENFGDDYNYAQRKLRLYHGAGEKKYVADKPSQEGEGWIVVVRDDWGDGDVVETLKGETEDEAQEAADEYIKENSPYYGVHETETDDYGVWDKVDDQWTETGLSPREAERAADRENSGHFDSWWEDAHNEAWDIIKGDIGKAVEFTEDALDYVLNRNELEELKDTPGYEAAVRQWVIDEYSVRDLQNQSSGSSRRDDTKFSNWVLRGGKYYREYILAAPNMDTQGIDIRTHFGSVSKNVIGHFRANDFETADGGVAMVAQEFQSDGHQDASDARQTLIKKYGFKPSPTLGYGDADIDVAGKVRAAISEELSESSENRMQVRSNFFKKLNDSGRVDEIAAALDVPPNEDKPEFNKVLVRDFVTGFIDNVYSFDNAHRDFITHKGGFDLARWNRLVDYGGMKYVMHGGGMATEAFGRSLYEAFWNAKPVADIIPGATSFGAELRGHIGFHVGARRVARVQERALKKHERLDPVAPERMPFKQSWTLLEFKILLHEAIKNGYDYLALTTGDQQVERYGSALKAAIKDIYYKIDRGTGKAKIKINLRGKPDPHRLADVDETELGKYIGKKAANDIFNTGSDEGHMDGNSVEFRSPGIINHYDRGIQSETKKFLESLDMRWAPLDIGSTTRTSSPVPKQEFTLIQRGTRPDGTVQEARLTRSSRQEIEDIMANAQRLADDRERLLREHGYTDYSHELIEPPQNLPAVAENRTFNKLHTVHGVKISEKARMWMQGSPEQPTKRFLKYQVETPDHANDPARYQVDHHDTPEFKRFFGKSYATEDLKPGGRPIELYRGEHGKSDGRDIQSRLPSITLTDDVSIANLYAGEPNDRRFDKSVTAPRVGKYYARIENPLFVEKDDPFAELGPLAKKLGLPALMKVIDGSERIETAIRDTSVWDEKYSDYGSVRELLDANPDAINELYAQSNILLDNRDFVDLAKSKGYDGAIHLGWSAAKDAVEYRVFDQGQLKSAIGNSGAYDPNDPRMTYQIETPDGLIPADPAVNTPRFKVWFKKSKIVDALGHPLRVFHGSMKDFMSFSKGAAYGETFLGRRFYFTDHPEDASDNYAKSSAPDIQAKLGKFLDENPDATEEDFWAGSDNEGVVYPVYLSIQNPVTIGGPGQTRFKYRDLIRLAQAVKHAEGLNPIMDGHGKLSEVINELALDLNHGDGIEADQLIIKLKDDDRIYDIIDDNGNNLHSELFRQGLETLGYDGIIDRHVNGRWRWIKPQEVSHYIAFRPNQIKSVFNRGTWSSRLEDIRYQVEGEDYIKTENFKKWLGDGLLKTADGEPIPVFHATGADFDRFRRNPDDIGFHFGTAGQANERYLIKAENADAHSDDKFRPNIMKLYSNIKNPFTLKDNSGWDTDMIYRQLFRMFADGDPMLPFTIDELNAFARNQKDAHGEWKPRSLHHLKKLFVSKGYDSIVYYNEYEKEGWIAAEKAHRAAVENHLKAVERANPGRNPSGVDPMSAPAEWAAVLQAERAMKQAREQKVPSYIAFYPNQLKSVFNTGSWSLKKRHLRYQTEWEDAPQSGDFLDSLREGFGGQWENLDEDVRLSSDEADLKRVYRKDWLDMRRTPNNFQFALMYRGRPVGRINGVINGDTARLNWIGIIGGDEGLGDGAVRHLGAMLRLALPNEVRVLTGLRKGPQEAYAAEEQKAAPQPKPSGRTKVRTPGGSQDDPLIDYYRNLGRF